MQLIIQADDYGISEGVIYGVIKGIKDGVITTAGMFANMPCSPLAAELVKDYDICLGMDVNICTGPCVSNPADVPSIAKADGMMYTKKEHCQMDAQCESGDHMEYSECLKEVRAQIERFRELTGHYPEYLNGHSYHNKKIDRAVKELSEEYRIPMAKDMEYKNHMASPARLWYKRPFPFEEQIHADAMACIREDKAFVKNDYGILIFHCGYIDPALMEVSTFSLIRVNDLKAVISQDMKEWIRKNDIKLISYRDVKEEEAE